jgi:hypothetical protein
LSGPGNSHLLDAQGVLDRLRLADARETTSSASPARTPREITIMKRECMAPTKFVFVTCAGRDLPVTWETVAEHLYAPSADAA